MEATFVVNPQEVDDKVLGKMLDFFKDKKQPITVRLTTSRRDDFDWQEFGRGMEEARAAMQNSPVPDDIGDLDDLIDSMNDVEL